jgi:hypothetical protein
MRLEGKDLQRGGIIPIVLRAFIDYVKERRCPKN